MHQQEELYKPFKFFKDDDGCRNNRDVLVISIERANQILQDRASYATKPPKDVYWQECCINSLTAGDGKHEAMLICERIIEREPKVCKHDFDQEMKNFCCVCGKKLEEANG